MGLALNRKASKTIKRAEEIISKLRENVEHSPTNDLIMADLLSVMLLVQFDNMLISDAKSTITKGLEMADKEDKISTTSYRKVMTVSKNLLKLLDKGITVNLCEVLGKA